MLIASFSVSVILPPPTFMRTAKFVKWLQRHFVKPFSSPTYLQPFVDQSEESYSIQYEMFSY